MCGVCGKLIFKNIIPERALISRMCGTMIHRGPDDEGIFTAPHIGLGQRRLSIIDLSPNACPPLANEDGEIRLVLNGEIYNYKQLREELLLRGHKFITKSDTEVIIHLYEEEGVNCLRKLRGMFAFALWDNNRKILFCARDRLGKKPFCYTLTTSFFAFGSEIKAITADPGVTVSPNFNAIDQYLTYQFVPSPHTAFQGINRLRPGEYLICDLKGNLETRLYWEPTIRKKVSISVEEIKSEILRRLKESVKLRLLSDVPLGAFLSGGIDSSTVVALMAIESNRPVKTFSVGFEEDAFNELPYARLLAKRYGTDHHELVIKANAAEILPLLVRHYNEPFADSSALPTFYISQFTQKYVSVALSGDGGDESFAGYDHYIRILNWNKWNFLPAGIRKKSVYTGQKLLKPFLKNNYISRINRGINMIGAANLKDRYNQYRTILKPEEKTLAYTSLFRELLSTTFLEDPLKAYKWENGMDNLDWMMSHDQRFYLPDCLMVKTDIASMANGLEVRCPFLDFEFIEFAATIESNLKLNSNGGKVVLKSAVKDLLPVEILNKPKTGFAIPVAKWLRNELAPLLKENLIDERSVNRGLFEQRIIKRMVNEHIEGQRDWSNRLWAFLFLELWFREFID